MSFAWLNSGSFTCSTHELICPAGGRNSIYLCPRFTTSSVSSETSRSGLVLPHMPDYSGRLHFGPL